MSSFQIHLDSQFADVRYDSNASVYFLPDPVSLPSPFYEFHVSVPAATIPLTYWIVDWANRALHLEFAFESLTINLPLGNHPIGDLVAYIDSQLIDGYAVEYLESINRVVFRSDDPAATITVGADTTCGDLLGLVVGQTGAELTGAANVNLAGTRSIFIRSNLSTKNRDPVTRAGSNILAKVHVERSFNEIEFYSSASTFALSDRNISAVVIYLTDDAQNPLDLHGADYSLTLEVSIRKKEEIRHAVDYRISGLLNNVALPRPRGEPTAQPPDVEGGGGGSKRGDKKD